MNWPGRAAVRERPSVGSSISEVTVLLSRTLRDTRSGRNPGHAAGGPDAGASPAFPLVASPLRCCSSSAWNEARQPGLSAGTRSARRDLHDLIAGLHLALFQDAEIETGSTVGDQQRRHLRLIHADAHSVTGDSRLRNFEHCAADPIAVADTHLSVGQAVDREVLPELAIDEVVSTKLPLPIAIGVDLIDEDGPVLAAVPGQIPLPVAVDIEPTHHTPALNRCLPNAGVNGLSSPRHFARKAYVDRKQVCRHFLLPLRLKSWTASHLNIGVEQAQVRRAVVACSADEVVE